MATNTNARLAILDDYPGIARQHFTHITGLEVDVFQDTIDPATDAGLRQVAQRLQPYQIISTMRERTPIRANLLAQLPNLKLLLTTAMRNAALDLEAASEQGVVVAGTHGNTRREKQRRTSVSESGAFIPPPPPPGGDSTAQHMWALLLSLCARIPADDRALKTDPKAWQSGFSYALGGRTIGLLGLGRLGGHAARTASLAFGMKVIAWSENLSQEKADAAAEAAGLPKGTYQVVGKDELFREADVLSLHSVLSDRTRNIVAARELSMMKPTSILVNTSRAGLIEEQALLGALEVGAIKGTALDVFWQEPLPADSPWRSTAWGTDGRSEVVLSPHMGYVNEGTMHAWYVEQAEMVEQFMNGEEVMNIMNATREARVAGSTSGT